MIDLSCGSGLMMRRLVASKRFVFTLILNEVRVCTIVSIVIQHICTRNVLLLVLELFSKRANESVHIFYCVVVLCMAYEYACAVQ